VSHHSAPARKILERRRLLALLGAGAASLVAACGKQGPLRLPEPPPPAETSEEAE
jgi:predicted small lipoprotein YifL